MLRFIFIFINSGTGSPPLRWQRGRRRRTQALRPANLHLPICLHLHRRLCRFLLLHILRLLHLHLVLYLLHRLCRLYHYYRHRLLHRCLLHYRLPTQPTSQRGRRRLWLLSVSSSHQSLPTINQPHLSSLNSQTHLPIANIEQRGRRRLWLVDCGTCHRPGLSHNLPHQCLPVNLSSPGTSQRGRRRRTQVDCGRQMATGEIGE